MPSPCNNVSVYPIKVSQLVRYSNLDGGDILLTVESGSSLLSRHSTINDLKVSMGKLTGSYSGSFTGSLVGNFLGVASGSFSGSYWGKVISKNTKATGSFSGSHWGSLVSKNTKATGSFSGSHWGSLVSKNTKATGSFSGSYWGKVISKNTIATGSFSGSHWGSLVSKNTKATGSFSGTNSKLSGSFSGSYWGSLISKNGKITGSFKGIDNILNFKNTGKKVSVNATSSYAVSSSYALTSSYVAGGSSALFSNASYSIMSDDPAYGTPSIGAYSYGFPSIIVTSGKTVKWFKVEGSVGTGEGEYFILNGLTINGTLLNSGNTSNLYTSWNWGRQTRSTDNANPPFSNRAHFTIEGQPPAGLTTGTLTFAITGGWPYGNIWSGGLNGICGYVVVYY